MLDEVTVEIFIKICLAALLGGLIGLERELHGQAAGLRTHMIVSTGSCLIMLVSIFVPEAYPNLQADPGRIAAQAVTGIGFLGGAAILKYGFTIRGLTTAACIWAACAVGLGTGIGFFSGSVICTVVILITVSIFDKLEKVIINKREYRTVCITYKGRDDFIDKVKEIIKEKDILIKKIDVDYRTEGDLYTVSYLCSSPRQIDIVGLVADIKKKLEPISIQIS